MPQIRMTTKVAKALKVKDLTAPKNTIDALDDWCVDILEIKRKSYFILMHMASRLAICIPKTPIRGIEKFLKQLPSIFDDYFTGIGYPDIGMDCYDFFLNAGSMAILTKIASNSVIAHMTQFKREIECEFYRFAELNPALPTKCNKRWAEGLVKIPGSDNDYNRPFSVLEDLLSETQNLGSNVLKFDLNRLKKTK